MSFRSQSKESSIEESDSLRDNPSQISLNNSSLMSDQSQNPDQSPKRISEVLFNQIQKFIQKSHSIKSAKLRRSYKRLREEILANEKSQQEKLSKPFSVDLLEHSHYIYSFKHEPLLTNQEDISLFETRIRQFDVFNYPHQEMYLTILKAFQFLSHLMTKWGLFNIYNYNYRYRGRSLTLKLIDMNKINQQYLSPDIIWLSYAIHHQPFTEKIDNVVLNYSGILQFELNKILDFIKSTNLDHTDFKVYSKWKFYKKTHPDLQKLYTLLKSIETAYKYFEKHLIQNLIKLT